MIARLLISPSLEARKKELEKILTDHNLASHPKGANLNHPDLLYFPDDSKLGIAEARKIKDHFSLKPYSAKGRGVVLEDASTLTIEAQNALLKILEELPEHALFILGSDSESKLLPTVISRCQIVQLKSVGQRINGSETLTQRYTDIQKLLAATLEERFEYVEKLKDREEFLYALIAYFHHNLPSHLTSGNTEFLKELLRAEEYQKQNVNIRAILEYLMLKMPQKL